MVEQILRAAREPDATVSQLMSLVSLSWESWQELLPKMRAQGLLLVKDEFYRTTDKGLDYIAAREKLKGFLQLA
jgi:predicted transcriptional regulator